MDDDHYIEQLRFMGFEVEDVTDHQLRRDGIVDPEYSTLELVLVGLMMILIGAPFLLWLEAKWWIGRTIERQRERIQRGDRDISLPR